MAELVQHVLTSIELNVAAEAIASEMSLSLDVEEENLAVTAIRSYRIAEFRGGIVDTLETRYLEAAERQRSLIDEFKATGAEMAIAEEALSMRRQDTENTETPKPEQIVGQVAFDTFRKVLEAHGWSSKLITNNWKDIIELATSEWKQRDWPSDFSIPEPENVVRDISGYIPNAGAATIDASAFVRISQLFHSFGPHYTDELKAIKALKPLSTAMPLYHTFKMWDDFARHCRDEQVVEDLSTQNIGTEIESSISAELIHQSRHRELLVQTIPPTGNQLYAHLENEPPFILWFDRDKSFSYPYWLRSWIERNQPVLKAQYGDGVRAMNRAANCLARGLNTVIDRWTKKGAVSETIVDPEDETRTGLVINDPMKFFDEALAITNFGVKSAIATLCIADMQRLEMKSRGSSAVDAEYAALQLDSHE